MENGSLGANAQRCVALESVKGQGMPSKSRLETVLVARLSRTSVLVALGLVQNRVRRRRGPSGPSAPSLVGVAHLFVFERSSLKLRMEAFLVACSRRNQSVMSSHALPSVHSANGAAGRHVQSRVAVGRNREFVHWSKIMAISGRSVALSTNFLLVTHILVQSIVNLENGQGGRSALNHAVVASR